MDLIEIRKRLIAAVTDRDFERMKLALDRPNIFQALRLTRTEIRHSNFLSYLLDPNESHGLDDRVLRKFLRDVFSDERCDRREIFDADAIELHNVEVRREWRHIDVLIVLPHDVVAIENKVDSLDHSEQLDRYVDTIRESFGARRQHFVYLTPEGTPPRRAADQQRYVNYSYQRIAELLQALMELHHDSIGEKIRHYLADYLLVIKRDILMNDDLNELADKVYRTHRAAFDFVFEHRPDPATLLRPYFEAALRDAGFVIGSRNKGYARFTTPRLNQLLPCNGEGWPQKEIFLFEIDYFWNPRSAVFKAVVSPGGEPLSTQLLAWVQTLDKDGLYKQPQGKKWRVFLTKMLPFVATDVLNEDEDEIRRRVGGVVAAVKDNALTIAREIEARLGNDAAASGTALVSAAQSPSLADSSIDPRG